MSGTRKRTADAVDATDSPSKRATGEGGAPVAGAPATDGGAARCPVDHSKFREGREDGPLRCTWFPGTTEKSPHLHYRSYVAGAGA